MWRYLCEQASTEDGQFEIEVSKTRRPSYEWAIVCVQFHN